MKAQIFFGVMVICTLVLFLDSNRFTYDALVHPNGAIAALIVFFAGFISSTVIKDD